MSALCLHNISLVRHISFVRCCADIVRTYISRNICPHYILLRFSAQAFSSCRITFLAFFRSLSAWGSMQSLTDMGIKFHLLRCFETARKREDDLSSAHCVRLELTKGKSRPSTHFKTSFHATAKRHPMPYNHEPINSSSMKSNIHGLDIILKTTIIGTYLNVNELLHQPSNLAALPGHYTFQSLTIVSFPVNRTFSQNH